MAPRFSVPLVAAVLSAGSATAQSVVSTSGTLDIVTLGNYAAGDFTATATTTLWSSPSGADGTSAIRGSWTNGVAGITKDTFVSTAATTDIISVTIGGIHIADFTVVVGDLDAELFDGAEIVTGAATSLTLDSATGFTLVLADLNDNNVDFADAEISTAIVTTANADGNVVWQCGMTMSWFFTATAVLTPTTAVASSLDCDCAFSTAALTHATPAVDVSFLTFGIADCTDVLLSNHITIDFASTYTGTAAGGAHVTVSATAAHFDAVLGSTAAVSSAAYVAGLRGMTFDLAAGAVDRTAATSIAITAKNAASYSQAATTVYARLLPTNGAPVAAIDATTSPLFLQNGQSWMAVGPVATTCDDAGADGAECDDAASTDNSSSRTVSVVFASIVAGIMAVM